MMHLLLEGDSFEKTIGNPTPGLLFSADLTVQHRAGIFFCVRALLNIETAHQKQSFKLGNSTGEWGINNQNKCDLKEPESWGKGVMFAFLTKNPQYEATDLLVKASG